MKHYLFTGLCILLNALINGVSFAQQGNVWTFGVNARVDFSTAIPTVGTSAISTYEGCASISDNAGNLIFYTDGINVWNNSNTLVNTGLMGHPSAAQSGIIVPEPGTTPGSSTNRYYIFSIPQLATERVRFSIYDAISGTVPILNNTMPDHATAANTTEAITVARHCNGIDYWVITHEMGNNRFKAYLITNSGVQAPVVSAIGPAVPTVAGTPPNNNINAASYMKISPTNNRLAFIVRRTSVDLFDFNPSTGSISNPVNVVTGVNRNYYGVEFSPNGNVLYYTDVLTGIYEYNILAPATTTLVALPGVTNDLYGALQLAPNGSIYMARDGDSNMGNLNQPFLGEISNPDTYGGATYNPTGLALASGTASKCGLPNIIPTLTTSLPNISGDNVICNGESTTLTATGGTTYTWSPSTGLNTTTGASVIASPTSTQIYTVTSTINNCVISEQITVEVENCCFASIDPAFTTIAADPNYTTHTVLSGKYYVAPNVIITVDGTTLDMTNVDIVFDECSGINFVNGAEIIAYNSVFRTCDDTRSWRGFSFSSSSGNISESTFKNAQKAIKLEKASSVRITNNNFLNNQIGIYVLNNTQSEAISGNEFTIDNLAVDYQACGNTFVNTDAYGVWARQGIFNDVISQNTFVNADFLNLKKVYGIYFTEFTNNADISANSFTNQFTSIYTSKSSGLSIQNNIVELTDLYSYPGVAGEDIQFYFPKGTNNSTISGNTLKGRSVYSNFGIYMDANDRMFIHDNELSHFGTSIKTVNSAFVEVKGNTIEHSSIGIHSENTQNSYFGCNIINCLRDESTGILFVQNVDALASSKIIGNCIYNTYNAINLNKSTAAGSGTLPQITNNFLYSYRNIGVSNINFNGNIGSGLTGLTAGKNTFSSNNVAGGAIDISSNTPLTSFGNYGVTTISTNVTLNGNNTFYSTAACGNQLGNATTQFTPNDFCQNTGNNLLKSLVSENGTLSNDFEAEVTQLVDYEKVIVLEHIANKLSSANTTNDMSKVHNFVLESTLSSNDKYHVLAELYRKQPVIANTYLELIEGQPDFVSIAKINLATSSEPMTSQQFNELMILQESTSEYREMAREALNVQGGGYPYRLEQTSAITNGEGQGNTISVNQNNLVIYPNPATNKVFFQVSIPSNEKSTLTITDLSGKVIHCSEILEDFRVIDLDISTLKDGLYIVTIQQHENLLLTSKLSILH